jgi:biopolymer transport protein TolR
MAAASSGRRVRRTKNEINMVPFIDVMLVLLIIFMVTAPLIAPSQIDLPSVGQANAQPKTFIQVIVDKDEKIEVQEGSSSKTAQETDMNGLVDLVQRMQSDTGEQDLTAVPVVISADKNIKYETVVKVMDTLRRAGIERVGLSVQTTN